MENISLKRLMFDKQLNQSELAEIIGVQQSVISKFVRGARQLLPHHIQRLKDYFGEEVIKYYSLPDTMEMSQTRTADIPIYASDEDAENIDGIPVITPEQTTKRNFNLRNYIERGHHELEIIDPRDLVAGAQAAFRVLKNAMSPDFQQGDTVFVQFLPDEAKLTSGDIYFIDTPAHGGKIRQVECDGDAITLKASHPDYADVKLSRSRDIYSAARIVGMFRQFFGSSSSEIRDIYKRKDAQIENILSLQRKSIEEICLQNERLAAERERSNTYIDKLLNKQ